MEVYNKHFWCTKVNGILEKKTHLNNESFRSPLNETPEKGLAGLMVLSHTIPILIVNFDE